MMKLLCQLFIISALSLIPPASSAEREKTPWPFDQRQILLVKESASAFPDDLTVAQIQDVFVRRGRIRWVTQKSSDLKVEPVVVPSDFAWHSTPAVRKLGLRHQADGIVVLTQEDSKLDLKWYSTTDGLPLFFESIKLPAVTSDSEWKEVRKKRLVEWVEGLWNQIPGHGFVVQRDGGQLLLEGVSQGGGVLGDRVDFIRVDSVERHPLLKTIVKINTSETGHGKVLSASKDLSKGEIVYEAQLDPVQAGDRYILSKESKTEASQVKGAKQPVAPEAQKTSQEPGAKPARVSFFENKKKMIDLSASFTLSSFIHKEVVSGTRYDMKSSKASPGADLKALLYFTHAWLMGTNVSLSFFDFRDVPASYGVNSISSGLTSFSVYGGYRFLFLEKLAAPADLRILAGYRSWGLSMQNTVSDFAPSAKTLSGLEVGLSVGFPIYKGVSAEFRGARTVGTALTEKPLTSGDAPAPTFWTFGGKLAYALNKENQVELGYTLESSTINFDGAGQRARAASSLTMQRKYIGVGYTHAF